MLHIHELVIVKSVFFESRDKKIWNILFVAQEHRKRNKNFPRKNTRKNCCLPQYSVSVTAKQAVKLFKITKNYYFYLK